jgi:hypothetical protein
VDSNPEKIRGILKHTDDKMKRTENVKNVRFMANEIAEDWSVFKAIDYIQNNSFIIFKHFLKIWVVPSIYRAEKMFSGV